jgi:amidohydrolase
MQILEEVKKHEAAMLKHFRHLHANPELSGEERETVAYVTRELSALGIPYVVVENGGILGFIEGASGGKTVMLRADLDALPITEDESNGLCPRRVISKNRGVMHACGHDGHTAMLLTAAKVLQENRDQLPGKIILMFERGEEATANVIMLYEYIAANKIKIDSTYAIHLYYALETGKIAILSGPVNACAVLLEVTITGKGGHGSRPDQANSPIDCFVAIYNALQASRMKYISPYDPATFSIGKVQSGAAYNIIPNELTFGGSYRFTSVENAKKMAVESNRMVEHICAAYDCRGKINIRAAGLPVYNDPRCADIARDSIGKAIGGERVCLVDPWMASETYGMTSRIWRSVFALVGIKNDKKGTGREHHNSAFEVDEDALVWGAASAAAYALGFLSSPAAAGGAIFKQTLRDLYEETGMSQFALDMYKKTGTDIRGLDASFV